jgi:hypothetical protein
MELPGVLRGHFEARVGRLRVAPLTSMAIAVILTIRYILPGYRRVKYLRMWLVERVVAHVAVLLGDTARSLRCDCDEFDLHRLTSG